MQDAGARDERPDGEFYCQLNCFWCRYLLRGPTFSLRASLNSSFVTLKFTRKTCGSVHRSSGIGGDDEVASSREETVARGRNSTRGVIRESNVEFPAAMPGVRYSRERLRSERGDARHRTRTRIGSILRELAVTRKPDLSCEIISGGGFGRSHKTVCVT